jgi:type VII secretion-associated serine protease mycosin
MLTRGRPLRWAAASLAVGALIASAAGPAWAAGAGRTAGPGAGGAAVTAHAGPATSVAALARADERAVLRAIAVPAAWRLSRGRGVTVGVLDTGVGAGVPDLAASVTHGPDFTRGADPPGYQPPHLHGTYIASLIAGHGSGPRRAEGVLGVAPAARVLSVRVILDDAEPGFSIYNSSARFSNAIAKGIRYAVKQGVSVINMSLGSATPTRATRAAIAYAISRGVVVVAAAGNNGAGHRRYSAYSYPASYTGVISVAAATARGTRASFSERNASVLVAAPGVNVVGASPHGRYLRGSGTSPASAFVAGVAALIRARYPRLSPAQVTLAIVSSTRHRPAAGYRPATGFGEVDAVAAVRAAGRLAAARAAGEVAPYAHFGPGPAGPVPVVHRDMVSIWLLAGIAIAGVLGFLGALAMAGRLTHLAIAGRRRAVGTDGQI